LIGYTNASVVYPSNYGIKKQVLRRERFGGRVFHEGREIKTGI
jgi:hypothetical protein